MSLLKLIPPHLRVSAPVLFAYGLLFFTFHRPTPLPANQYQVSWFPSTSCEEAWGGRNLARYNFEQDNHYDPATEGNFGYPSYEQRLLEDMRVMRENCYKEWTVLVYMAANNDLRTYAFWDLYEMEAGYSMQRAGSTLVSDLVVDLQTEAHPYSRRLHIFQSDKRFEKEMGKDDFQTMTLDDIHSPIAKVVENDELASEENLFDFLEWGVKKYPAKNYMVVIWGHGQGWSADDKNLVYDNLFSGRFGGLAFQKYNQHFLTTPALSRVLKKVEEQVFEGEDKIDVYASDACLMQQLEVAYEIAPHTRYIVGSAQIQTYLGLPYRRLMYEVNRGCYNTREKGHAHCDDNLGLQEVAEPTQYLQRVCGDDEACYMARMIPGLTRQSFSDPNKSLQYPGDPDAIKSLTMSSLRAGILKQGLPNHLHQIGTQLRQFFKSASFEQREEYLQLMKSFETYPGDTRELTIAIGKMEHYFVKNQQNSIVTALKSLDHWLGELVVAKAFGNDYIEKGYHLMSAKLVSVWIPSSPEVLMHREEDYEASQLYKDLYALGVEENQWQAWMRELFYPSNPPPLN